MVKRGKKANHNKVQPRTGAYKRPAGAKLAKSTHRKSSKMPHKAMSKRGGRKHASNSTAGNNR